MQFKISKKTKKFLLDLSERMFWTGVQAALALISVETLDIPKEYIPVIALALAGAKGYVAKHVGSKNTAALLPAGPDTDKG